MSLSVIGHEIDKAEVENKFERITWLWNRNEGWVELLEIKINIAGEDRGYTKERPRKFELWWWNKNMEIAVDKKGELFKLRKKSYSEAEMNYKVNQTGKNVSVWVKDKETLKIWN